MVCILDLSGSDMRSNHSHIRGNTLDLHVRGRADADMLRDALCLYRYMKMTRNEHEDKLCLAYVQDLASYAGVARVLVPTVEERYARNTGQV